MTVNSYRDLVVWQRAMDLVEACYKIVLEFPPDERYGLSSQLKRAVVSIPANIAEGHGRDGLGEYIHFLGVAQGSLRESETHLLLAGRLGFISKETLDDALRLSEEISRMLGSLMRSLKGRRNQNLTPNT
ncbi:MAG: four helix bundle protein [Chloracidobacterium sp.]|nr:four helix bundle protein [Chloracidobacterium sp.]